MRRVIVVLTVILPLFLIGCTTSLQQTPAAEHLLRFSVNTDQSSPSGIAAQAFADMVSERSEGIIVLVPYFNDTLGDENAVMEQLALGGIDLGFISLQQLSEEYEEMQIFCLPYLFSDRSTFFASVEAGLCDSLYKQLQEDSLHALTWFDQGALSFCSSKWGLTTPDSFLMQTAAVTAGAIACDTVTALGADALLINRASISAAYDAHLVSIAEVSLLDYLTANIYSCAPYLLLDEHIYTPALLIMGQPTVDRLSSSDIALIRACAAEAASYGRQLQQETEQEALASLEDRGVHVSLRSELLLLDFRAAALRVYVRYTPAHRSLYDRIVAFRNNY